LEAICNHASSQLRKINGDLYALISRNDLPGSGHAWRPRNIIENNERAFGEKGNDSLEIRQGCMLLVITIYKNEIEWSQIFERRLQ